MAIQSGQQVADNVNERTKGVTNNTPAGDVTGRVQGYTNTALGAVENVGNRVAKSGRNMLDRIFPPDKRDAFFAKLQAFMLANPKLSAFLGMNLVLSGIPLFLFILFSITVFLFSVIVALVIALLAAVAFTLFAVGLALLVVLPTVFFTTGTACFLFLWGLGGYYILRWANGEKGTGQAEEGNAIGDKLNRLTGGRLTGFMDSARAQNAEKEKAPASKASKIESADTNVRQEHAPRASDSNTKAPANLADSVKGGLRGL